MPHLVAFGLILISLLPTRAEAWRGKLERVIGADVVVVYYARSPAHVRLGGLEIPPEMARGARRLVHELAAGKKTARVLPVGSDRGLVMALVFVGRTCLNEELVRAGLARWDHEAVPRDRRLAAAQDEARRAGRGVWAREPGASIRGRSTPARPPGSPHRPAPREPRRRATERPGS